MLLILTNSAVYQVTLPANLLCFDLLNLFCNRGDGRFVLKEKVFKIQIIFLLSNPN